MTTDAERSVVVAANGCPCCAGADVADWTLLCDQCLEAWVIGNWQHRCDREAS